QNFDPKKRHHAIWELGQRGDSRAVQPLVNLLIDSDSKQQSLILATLSEIGTKTLKPMNRALAMSIQNDNAEVRKNAIRDLTRIYELVIQTTSLLQQAEYDPDPEVEKTAKWALEQLNRIRPR
ncbi:MAG: HEAT repeat domain-containing protein, partial [Okeania sp. SIO2D1]|nr:HEAT repeat domain-containing protein [Okeania sp. SIO2D1]